MGFTAFKQNYISQVNGDGFPTTGDTASFIANEYETSVMGGLNPSGPGPFLSSPASKIILTEGIAAALNSEAPSLQILELKLSAALMAYWTLAVMTVPTFIVTLPGIPVVGVMSDADTVEDFLDQLITLFEQHLSGLIFVMTAVPPVVATGYTVP